MDQTLDDYEEQEESQNICFVVGVPVRDIMLFPKHPGAASIFVHNLTFRSCFTSTSASTPDISTSQY